MAIALAKKGRLSHHIFIQPLYSITFTAVQHQLKPSPRLSVCEDSEIWVEDGNECLRRIVVGKCQGRVQGSFFFSCWGCKGIPDNAHDHQDCPYGIVRVDRQLLYPEFNEAAFPDRPFSTYRMKDCWRHIQPDHHLRLALVYPPGYAPKSTTWYEYIIPFPIFTARRELLHAVRDRAVLDSSLIAEDEELRRILEAESRLGRRVALQTREYARNIAELCRTLYTCRTHQCRLALRGV